MPSQKSDFRTLLYAVCSRFVVLMLICVFAENLAIFLYLLSPYSRVISVSQFIFFSKILCVTFLLAFAGFVALKYLQPSEDDP